MNKLLGEVEGGNLTVVTVGRTVGGAVSDGGGCVVGSDSGCVVGSRCVVGDGSVSHGDGGGVRPDGVRHTVGVGVRGGSRCVVGSGCVVGDGCVSHGQGSGVGPDGGGVSDGSVGSVAQSGGGVAHGRSGVAHGGGGVASGVGGSVAGCVGCSVGSDVAGRSNGEEEGDDSLEQIKIL